MNPGKVVAPNRLDENLRLGARLDARATRTTHFALPQDDGRFDRGGAALRRRRQLPRATRGGVMCPSYRATGEEEHSTRGRARLLFEMLDGHADSADHRRLALHRGQGRPRPVPGLQGLQVRLPGRASTWPPTRRSSSPTTTPAGCARPRTTPWAGCRCGRGVAALAPRAGQRAAARARAGRARQAAGRHRTGAASRRASPRSRSPTGTGARGPSRGAAEPRAVLLWPDTFTDYFHPHDRPGGRRGAGGRRLPGRSCRTAAGVLRPDLDLHRPARYRQAGAAPHRRTLAPHLRRGIPVVGLEPSCTAVFRADAPELLPDDRDVARLREQTRTLAELLTEHARGWQPPRLDRRRDRPDRTATSTPFWATTPTGELLRRRRGRRRRLDAGCCGLAGNFGFERGHLRGVDGLRGARRCCPPCATPTPATLVLADGFSCRTQIEQGGTGRRALHLAEALALGLDGHLPTDRPERLVRRLGIRPRRPRARRPDPPGCEGKGAGDVPRPLPPGRPAGHTGGLRERPP